MEKDLISIVIPVYNVEKYLKKCIESVMKQTYKNLEIILVDDGSTDLCSNICDEYEKKDKRIKVIHKANGGLSDARNCGIDMAKGEYIGFVDSDDFIEEEMYERMYECIKKTNSDISICGKYIDYENGKSIPAIKDKETIVNEMTSKEALIKLNSFYKFDMATWDKLYKRELFKDIRFPYGKKCEDYYTTYKLFDKSKKIVYFSTPLYHYFQRENSISRSKNIPLSYIEASENQLEYFKKNHKDIINVAETAYAFANIATYNAYVNNNLKCNKALKRKFKKAINENIITVLFNRHISVLKKVQALTFFINMDLYALMFINVKKINRRR